MISYIILTYLLSIIGTIFYCLLLRKKWSARQQKGIIIGIVCLSLSIPFVIDGLQSSSTPARETCLHNHEIPEMVISQYCPANGELEMCYELAIHQTNFCECEAVEKANLLMYKEYPIYDFLITHQSKVDLFFLIGIGTMLVILLIRLTYLLFLIVSSQRKKVVFDGETYTILYPKKKIAVCSFKLWHNYILWQEDMEQLNEPEQQAIIWHEISHLQQRDTWLKIGFNLMQSIWWLNPVYYFFAKELERISEHIADELAVQKLGSTKLYASLLVKMKRRRNVPLAHAFNNSQLKIRVEYLLQKKSMRQKKFASLAGFFMLISLVLCSTTFYTMPSISKTMDDIRFYETLSKEYQNTGKSVFCKNCLKAKQNQK
ncbi:MAG: M56 family metallopeptidase [Chitinophagales bacterium]